jgi:Ca2+-binding EF-hand superfamily protein
VIALSVLSRLSVDQKLELIFKLTDVDEDGIIKILTNIYRYR